MNVVTPVRVLVVFGLVAAGVAAAGAGAVPHASERSGCKAGYQRIGSPSRAWVAVARGRLAAHSMPRGRIVARFGPVNVNDYPTVFSVRGRVSGRDCRPRWYLVQLPLRPNGRLGFVPARRVKLASVPTRIEVDVSAREVKLFRHGRLSFRTPAAVGARGTPTPIGRFYVNQRLVPYDTRGPFGPGALGISAYSTVLTGWAQGGPIAIHGTNDPSSIGRAVSNGCIRVPNRALRRLFAATPAGTPVVIHP